jgi:protein-disulfide isomerase
MSNMITEDSTHEIPVDERRDHILGPRNAAVTIIEYADFECPYCAQAHFILEDVLGEFDDEVRFVVRHFPLTQIHPHAQQAAEAAEAAAAQGRFWEMHDLLFENQHALDANSLLGYAEYLRLDVRRFQDDLMTGAHGIRVREDFVVGIRSGVNGTPSFFINGERYDGSWDRESLESAIEEASDQMAEWSPRSSRRTRA